MAPFGKCTEERYLTEIEDNGNSSDMWDDGQHEGCWLTFGVVSDKRHLVSTILCFCRR